MDSAAKHKTVIHDADICVVGGGMAGLTTAIAAARHGARVVLMHERPMLGGNSSSECRVHVCGADVHNQIPNLRETGILEEIRLENLLRNPQRSFSVWDAVLYDKVISEPNITLLLNCSCLDADSDNGLIRSVTGWQLTTETFQTVRARIFVDCSGDGILGPLAGAEFRIGREGRAEFGESIAPMEPDARTMGMTCLFQSREHATPQPFEPPAWARRFDSCDELPYGEKGHRWWQMGYWWVELGGEADSIRDTEKLREELLATTYGVWDHIKNRCSHRADAANWAIDWIQFLPAKRESRRFAGAHVLSQHDIESGGRFDDIVAYGGWSMDDHHPAGFNAVKLGAPATIFHPAPSPYGIPYRCLYSRNVRNLMFAGRNASCTHAAMSSTRVMGTGCSMGQAVGTAAAMATAAGQLPADVIGRIAELQQKLIRDDAYLPGIRQQFDPAVTSAALAASRGDPESVRDGINRPVGADHHAWRCAAGDWIEYRFARETDVGIVSIVCDSGLDQNIALSFHQKTPHLTAPPPVLLKAFRIEGIADGIPITPIRVGRNHQRLIRLPINRRLSSLRLTIEDTWGAAKTAIHAFAFSTRNQ